jgi:hypothetical protein
MLFSLIEITNLLGRDWWKEACWGTARGKMLPFNMNNCLWNLFYVMLAWKLHVIFFFSSPSKVEQSFTMILFILSVERVHPFFYMVYDCCIMSTIRPKLSTHAWQACFSFCKVIIWLNLESSPLLAS